jgi:hypothetical protein
MSQAVATKSPTAAKGQPKPQAPPPPQAETTKAAVELPQPLSAALQSLPDLERKVEQLGPARLTAAEFLRNVHVADAAPGTQPGDLEVPSYWAHVAQKLKARDRIEVWVDDNAWYAEVVVLGCTKTEAICKVLGAWDLNGHQLMTDRTDTALKSYRVEFRGHFEKWGVIRKVDDQVVHTGESTEGGAFAWLKERLKAGV